MTGQTDVMAGTSREDIVRHLGHVPYHRFLVYLLGPYKSFTLNDILNEEERDRFDIDDLPGPFRRLFRNRDQIDRAQALLRRVQGSLRTNPGVNAFLAVDVGIDTAEIDAVSQSIDYSRVSNATAFIVPYLGHNFGVGEEAGSILETLATSHGDRIVFAHEREVSSEMIRSARVRWDLRIETYGTDAELIAILRRFVVTIMNRERIGDLEYRR